ncbi:MAG: sigma-70 family RNA polymerase sigma factor [Clostridium perfringens]|nr:sigma-70 family RNA polymerase sigma factor [Clostridium perfringens]MDM0943541.1 sigma-70 family RNA polymerase sigma factor [Clostridium perfringens]MDU7156934.1 sigma-70 family RNA polymerase sigma factor [Clostridium perfringens]
MLELISFFNKNSFNKVSYKKLTKERLSQNFELLIKENLTSMYRVAKGILKVEEDIEDAIQTTILIAFNKINTLKDERYFKTWLIRILINECNKIYKKNKNTPKELSSELYITENYENIDLYDAIKCLKEDLRVITILFYFADMSYKDIAVALNIAEGTVKSRLFRAKEALYEILKDNI